MTPEDVLVAASSLASGTPEQLLLNIPVSTTGFLTLDFSLQNQEVDVDANSLNIAVDVNDPAITIAVELE